MTNFNSILNRNHSKNFPIGLHSSKNEEIWTGRARGIVLRENFELSTIDPRVHLEEVTLAIFTTNVVVSGRKLVFFLGILARLNHGCSRGFQCCLYIERTGVNFLHRCSFRVGPSAPCSKGSWYILFYYAVRLRHTVEWFS